MMIAGCLFQQKKFSSLKKSSQLQLSDPEKRRRLEIHNQPEKVIRKFHIK
jgi:hypothetical protein